jgi:hypothetical protein
MIIGPTLKMSLSNYIVKEIHHILFSKIRIRLSRDIWIMKNSREAMIAGILMASKT